MASELARRVRAEITYAGKNISTDLAPYIISLEFSDHAHGKADEIQLELDDAAGLFRAGWMPEKGGSLAVKLVAEHWEAPGDSRTLNCGTFEVDEVEFNGPPDVVTVKGVSAAVSGNARREKSTRAWEGTDLKAVAGQLASEHGYGLLYDAPETPKYDRVDQRNESDLAFLKRLCGERDLNLKVVNGKYVIFDGERYDAKEPVDSVSKSVAEVAGYLIGYSFKTQSSETYSDCEVSYWDPDQKKKVTGSASAEGGKPAKQTLKLNKKCGSKAEAETAAKKALRNKNKMETTADITCMGNPLLVAGVNVTLADFGRFSGKYAVEESKHRLDRSGGYVTSIKGRRV